MLMINSISSITVPKSKVERGIEFNKKVKEVEKQLTKNTYSIYAMWDAFCYYLTSTNDSYYLKKKASIRGGIIIFKEIWINNNKEFSVVRKLIAIKQDELNKLNKEYNFFVIKTNSINDNDKWGLLTNISDTKVALKVLKDREIELSKKTNLTDELYLTYEKYVEINNIFYYEAGSKIIEGKHFNMGSGLGHIEPRRVKRNFNRKTAKYKYTKDETEKKPTIYFSDDDYVTIFWCRHPYIRNITNYKFSSVHGNYTINEGSKQGLKKRFSRANLADKTLKLRYKYFSFTKYKEDAI